MILSQKLLQMPDGKPEMFYKAKINPIGMPSKMRCITKPTPTSQMVSQQMSDDFFHRNLQQFGDQPSYPFMNDLTLSSTMPTEVINQMMNNNNSYQSKAPQQHQQQQRFNNFNSFDDIMSSNSQSFYERNLKFQQQQQLQSLKRDFYNSSGMSNGSTSSSSITTNNATTSEASEAPIQ